MPTTTPNPPAASPALARPDNKTERRTLWASFFGSLAVNLVGVALLGYARLVAPPPVSATAAKKAPLAVGVYHIPRPVSTPVPVPAPSTITGASAAKTASNSARNDTAHRPATAPKNVAAQKVGPAATAKPAATVSASGNEIGQGASEATNGTKAGTATAGTGTSAAQTGAGARSAVASAPTTNRTGALDRRAAAQRVSDAQGGTANTGRVAGTEIGKTPGATRGVGQTASAVTSANAKLAQNAQAGTSPANEHDAPGTPAETESAIAQSGDGTSGEAAPTAKPGEKGNGTYVVPKVAKMWAVSPNQKLVLPDGMKLELPPNLPVVPGSALLTDEQLAQLRKLLLSQKLRQMKGLTKEQLKKMLAARKDSERPRSAAALASAAQPTAKKTETAAKPRSKTETKPRGAREQQVALAPPGMMSPFRYRTWNPVWHERYAPQVRDTEPNAVAENGERRRGTQAAINPARSSSQDKTGAKQGKTGAAGTGAGRQVARADGSNGAATARASNGANTPGKSNGESRPAQSGTAANDKTPGVGGAETGGAGSGVSGQAARGTAGGATSGGGKPVGNGTPGNGPNTPSLLGGGPGTNGSLGQGSGKSGNGNTAASGGAGQSGQPGSNGGVSTGSAGNGKGGQTVAGGGASNGSTNGQPGANAKNGGPGTLGGNGAAASGGKNGKNGAGSTGNGTIASGGAGGQVSAGGGTSGNGTPGNSGANGASGNGNGKGAGATLAGGGGTGQGSGDGTGSLGGSTAAGANGSGSGGQNNGGKSGGQATAANGGSGSGNGGSTAAGAGAGGQGGGGSEGNTGGTAAGGAGSGGEGGPGGGGGGVGGSGLLSGVDFGPGIEAEGIAGETADTGDANGIDTGFAPAVGVSPNFPEHNADQQNGLPGALVLPPLPPQGTETGKLNEPRPVKVARRAVMATPTQAERRTRPQAATQAKSAPPVPARERKPLVTVVGSASRRGSVPVTLVARGSGKIRSQGRGALATRPDDDDGESPSRPAGAQANEARPDPLSAPLPERALKAKRVVNSKGVRSGTKNPLPPTPLPDSDAELGDGSGLKGEYYLGRNFEQFQFTRADKNLDLFWGADRSPSPRLPIGADWSCRWWGRIQPRYSGVYTMFAVADDGVRVWVNHKLIIDDWTLHPLLEYSGQIRLEAGKQYDIRVDYFESGGPPASIGVYWESDKQQKEFLPESCLFYPLPGEKMDMSKYEKPRR